MRPYCLHCFGALPEGERHCPRGHWNRPGDHRFYWNRNPTLMRLEFGLKCAIVGVALVATIGLRFVVRGNFSGPNSAWVFLLPSMGAYGLWRCASKLTRHDYNFHPRYLWLAVFLLPVGPGLLLALVGLPGAVLFTVVCLALAEASWIACDEAAAWKRRLQHGQRTEAREASAR